MIGILSLNPCIDRTLTIPSLTPGATHRVGGARADLGGKGINVATALARLGEPVRVWGFDFGGQIAAHLQRMGIPFEGVPVSGTLRTNLKLFEADTGRMTELNENGAAVSEQAVQALLQMAAGGLGQLGQLVLTGSVPPGVPEDFYAGLIGRAKSLGVRTVLDAHGALLLKGIQAGPDLIKPNAQELSEAFGRPVQTPEQAAGLAQEIALGGVGLVCVSMGAQGAVLADARRAYFSPAPQITVRGVQGAGDAMVAGMCMALGRGCAMAGILRAGVAAAGGTLMREGTRMCRRQDYEAAHALVRVTAL